MNEPVTSGKWDEIYARLKKISKDDEAQFRMITSLKMLIIPLLSFGVMGAFLATLMQVDLLFFEANNLVKINNFAETFYEFFFNRLSTVVPWICLFLVIIWVTGFYVASTLLRPFRLIGEYCEGRVNGGDNSYDPEFFADLKLLTTFSEFFFNHIETATKSGNLGPVEIPKKYTRIHKPVFETSFFFQYSLYIIITSICVSIGMYTIAVDLHDTTIQLALQTMKQNHTVSYFLNKQGEVLSSILWGVMITHVFLYLVLALHLYKQISGPAFGIFATMRSYLKGNYTSRVHLIGHYYLRTQCRKLNKYLDYIQNSYTNRS